MEAAWADFTYLDFYRRHDWGLPAHIYDWYEVRYAGVQKEVRHEGDRRRTRLACPLGEVERVETRAEDGSWAPTQYFCRNVGDLEIMDYVNEHSRYEPRYEDVNEILRGIGEQGVADLVIPRSPFGKLVHYYLGFENVAYALHDDRKAIEAFLARRRRRDLELIRLAAAAPGRVVIISDHTDERLIRAEPVPGVLCPLLSEGVPDTARGGQAGEHAPGREHQGIFSLSGGDGFRYSGWVYAGADDELRGGGAGGGVARVDVLLVRGAGDFILRRGGPETGAGVRATDFAGVRGAGDSECGGHSAAERGYGGGDPMGREPARVLADCNRICHCYPFREHRTLGGDWR